MTGPPEARESIERERILARYFNVASIKGDNRQLAKRFLFGATVIGDVGENKY